MSDFYRRHGCFRWFMLAPLALLTLTTTSRAIAKDYAPHIMYVFQTGGQQGTTVEALIRGRGLEGAKAVRISGDKVTGSVIAVESPDDKLVQRSKNRLDQAENPNVVRISINIASDAALGLRDLRLETPKGVTNRFFFVVGQTPEIKEIEPNSKVNEAQSLSSLPALVNGQVLQGDRDIFRFAAKAGQTLVCDLQGQKLLPFIPDAVPGWLQASLTLYDPTGKQLAYVDDFRFHPDPILIYEVEKDGEYLLEVRDVLFRGREDLVYRLSIGTFPLITHIYPLGGQRGSEANVAVFGVNLPKKSLNLTPPPDGQARLPVRVAAGPLWSNAMPFTPGNLPDAHENEPNNTHGKPQRIALPAAINGRIQKPGDVDYFLLTAKAKQRLAFNVQARRLESPLDSIITLFNSKGKRLVENDDKVDPREGLITHHADSYLMYTFPADGEYVLRIADVQGMGGEAYSYRLSVAPPRHDFDLSVGPANLRVGQGATTVAKVKAFRHDGFKGPIDLAIEGLPEGFVTSPAVLAAGETGIRLTITAPAGARNEILMPRVVGTAQIGKRTVTRCATPVEPLMQAFFYWHDVPAEEFLLAVTPPPSFAISAERPKSDIVELTPGGNVQLRIKAARSEGAEGVIRISADEPPKGVIVKPTPIPAGQTEAVVRLSVTKQARVGLQQNLILVGTMKVEKDRVTNVVPAIPIRVIAAQPKDP